MFHTWPPSRYARMPPRVRKTLPGHWTPASRYTPRPTGSIRWPFLTGPHVSKNDTHFFNVFSVVLGLLVTFAILMFALARYVGESVFHDAVEISWVLPFLIVLAAIVIALAGAAQPLRRTLRMEPAAILRESV